MLGIESQNRLKDFLLAVANNELHIEAERQRLANIPDFEPYAAFCRINRMGDKRITTKELRDFLG